MNSWNANLPPAWDLCLLASYCQFDRHVPVPAIENIHERDGKNIWLLGTREIGDMSVKRYALQD